MRIVEMSENNVTLELSRDDCSNLENFSNFVAAGNAGDTEEFAVADLYATVFGLAREAIRGRDWYEILDTQIEQRENLERKLERLERQVS